MTGKDFAGLFVMGEDGGIRAHYPGAPDYIFERHFCWRDYCRGARALGDPLAVMVWLANQQSARGRGMKAGEIVSTGTCTGLDAVRAGQCARAQFGVLGAVEAAFD